MTFAGWMTVVGALLLTMALSSAFLRHLPISTSAIYLAAGIALGPLVFGLVREINVVRHSPHPEHRRQVEDSEDAGEIPDPPAEDLVNARVEAEALEEPAVAAGVLVGEVISFGDTLERLLEVLLVVMVGVALADAFNPRALLLGLALFCIIRPLATTLCLIGSPTLRAQRFLMGWFGIRGIGSLYYLSYALRHRPADDVERVIPIVVTIIALSVLLHGISGQPLLQRYERSLEE